MQGGARVPGLLMTVVRMLVRPNTHQAAFRFFLHTNITLVRILAIELGQTPTPFTDFMGA
jgi:hypothetical protein